ncbi:hypothetical protein SAMN04487926_13072 [Paraburkholderia steynii]|uniref:Uncharacterized protein n=1 Tax=Paraburkholderia steynii TaxID=1245441 RepID=A0A7Z7FKX7_9BURK|nr:hypothetical protein SAMN04487926_13072 [Paraburkholderia steynii]
MSSRRRWFLPVAITVNLTVAELLVGTGGRKSVQPCSRQESE